MTLATTLAFSALLVALAACSGAGPADPAFADDDTGISLPGPGRGRLEPTPLRQPLPGMPAPKLNPRERRLWGRLVTSLYAPCPEQAVSIAACIAENRPCAACKPAADLLARKVRGGATHAEAEAAYGVRFGPNVKSVDLTGAPARGAENSPVTVVVYSDFQCPACRFAMPEIDKIATQYGARLVHTFYPLKQHLLAEGAARAAIAAHRQGRYWEMEKALFEHSPSLEPSDLLAYARDLKLDLARFKADSASEATTHMLLAHRDEAERNGLEGTPFILVNGREFKLDYFRIDRELGPWIALELELAKGAKSAKGATGATLPPAQTSSPAPSP